MSIYQLKIMQGILYQTLPSSMVRLLYFVAPVSASSLPFMALNLNSGECCYWLQSKYWLYKNDVI
jgi:hypothetical protein